MKYIAAAVFAVALMFSAENLDWFTSGQEAIAATSQVHSGEEYALGRVEQTFWSNVKVGTNMIAMILVAYSLYGVFSTKTKQNKNDKQ